MTENDVAEAPANCLWLEISLYKKLSGKKKKLRILRSTSILVDQDMTVSELLERLNVCRVIQVNEAAVQYDTLSVLEMGSRDEDLSLSQIGWRHGTRLQLR